MTSEKCFECEGELTKTCLSCNTRAVPDVPELGRYGWNSEEQVIDPMDSGEYVRYDQAAAIIAEKEDQISLAETTMIQMHQELSALEAKLAASEAEIKRLRSLNHYAHLEAVAMRRAEAAEEKLEQYKKDAERYNYLKSADINTIGKGGIFVGKTPDNIVINGTDLDEIIDYSLRHETGGTK